MAITRQLARLLLLEHRYRPIQGRLMLLGRQTVFMSPEQAQRLVEEQGVSIRSGARIEIDQHTEVGKRNQFISDRSFFSLFSDAEVSALDHSKYEGADIIQDLCAPLADDLRQRIDFVYNGSVFDNVFDPASALRNVSRMLTQAGRAFHYEGMSHPFPAYVKFMPEWFFDYYAVNQFQDFKAWVCWTRDVHSSPYDLYQWWPFHVADNGNLTFNQLANPPASLHALVVVLAERGEGSTEDLSPIQWEYRSNHDAYVAAFSRFRASSRRWELPTYQPNGFSFVGSSI